MNAKRISFREISEFLSKKELMNLVGGGSDTGSGCGTGCGSVPSCTCFECAGTHATGSCCPDAGDCVNIISDACPYGYTSWSC